MNLYANHIAIRLMRSRWGSCNSVTRHISINLALARKPLECLDYVIIHELAHITHPNHSDKFWNLVGVYCPDWKSVRAQLRNS
ncbi:MAG: M48 family metallopeptidase [Prevotella sp.]|nr:M48 family metallopeptidase [Bacteroides sp.]MCM1366350.1 M48 family metallopeptidase [Prevotella sp.]MCM1436292.1 M48 family metallopeptidase [Prevotella sp.]